MIAHNDILMEPLVKVHHVRHLTDSAYVVRFDRNGREFRAGQHVILGIHGKNNAREYSIYSAEQDDYFEILVKEVLEGDLSRKLKNLSRGALLEISGPMGFFTIPDEWIGHRHFYLIATGTGIAPFHSFVRSYPELNYTLLHGVRYSTEAYDRQDYSPQRHILCTTGDRGGDFHGRVTDYLRTHEIITDSEFYLCGNVKMIHEAFDILTSKGVKPQQLHAEVYF